jgi:iron complex outermembrane receptor protein
MRLNHAGLLCALVGVPFVATQAVAAAGEATAQRPGADTIRVAQANPPAANGRDTASSTLEEVIVTAERRTGDIQKTGASVSVRTGEELAAQGRYTTRQILEDIPGISAIENGSTNLGTGDVQGNNITIRGIGPGAAASGGPAGLSAAPGAAVYVDGVYEGVGSGYDIDRVEVLRGPQGTLYGRSATTGVVAFHTRNPTLDGFNGNVSAEYGNYSLQHYSGGVNIPLTSTLAARVAGDYYDQSQGYYGIAGGAGISRGLSKRKNGRAKLLWKPSDDLSVLVGYAYETRQDFSGGNNTTAKPPTLVTTTTTRGLFPGLKIQREVWAEANWNIGPVTVTYQPSFRTWYQNDNNFVSANFISSGAAQFQLFKMNKDNFLTHELRVASREGSAVQWQAGAFYYRNDLENFNHNYLTPNGGNVPLSDTHDQKDTKNVGYFAEATMPLGASTRVTLGARYDDTKILVSEFLFDNTVALCGTALAARVPPGTVCTGVGTSVAGSAPGVSIDGVVLNFHNFNYKARLEYDLTPKNMLFGMISTGFRPGDAGVSNRKANYLAAEKLTSIELGSKNRFLDDSLQLNVGVYFYNYKGFQTSYIPNTPAFDIGGINTSVPVTVPAKNLGGEVELQYRLTPNDRVGLNYSYVQSKWYDKPAAFASAQPEEKRALTPYTGTANYEHVFNLSGGSTLSTRVDARYEAAHVTQSLHADLLAIGYGQYAYVGARLIGNVSAGWASNGGRYSVDAYVRNVTNKQYTTYGVGGDITSLTVTVSDPRTYGAQLSARF